MISLLSLVGDRGVLFGITSTSRLTSLGVRSSYWCSSWRSFGRCLSGTSTLCSTFSGGGVSGGGALPGAPPTGVVPCSLILVGDSSSLEALLCCTLTGSTFHKPPSLQKHKQQSPDRSRLDFRQSDRSTSVMVGIPVRRGWRLV